MQTHMTAVLSYYRTCIYFYVYKVAMPKNRTVLGCHDRDLNTDRKRRFFNFRKGTEVTKKGISSGLFSAAYKNGDQYYTPSDLGWRVIHRPTLEGGFSSSFDSHSRNCTVSSLRSSIACWRCRFASAIHTRTSSSSPSHF